MGNGRSGSSTRNSFHTLLALMFSFLISGCGPGFEALDPPNDEAILFKVNASLTPFSAPTGTVFQPMPLPQLSAAEVDALGVTPSGVSSQVVVPFNLEPQSRKGPSTATASAEPVPDLNVAPYNSGGRLEFTMGPDAFSCTGQLIGDQGVMLTAAHCAYDHKKGVWIDALTFKLRYNSGVSAQNFDWQCAAVFSGWSAKNYRYDFAFVKLRGPVPLGAGLEINVGSAPIDAIGYPANFGGAQRMHHVLTDKDANNPSAIISPMKQGSSGGGWFRNNFAVGLNSFGRNNDSTRVYGPGFTVATLRLYEFVSRGCTDLVRPLGGADSPLMSKQVNHTAITVMTPMLERVASGARLSLVADKTCACGGRRWALKNLSGSSRIVGLRRIGTPLSLAGQASTLDFELLNPGVTRPLQCQFAEPADNGLCKQAVSYGLAMDMRSDGPPTPPKPTVGVPMVASFAQRKIDQCVISCQAGNDSKCLRTGEGAIPILAPLSKLLAASDAQANAPDGVIVPKGSIIKEFGGDTGTVKDVCYRSDVSKEGFEITNKGLACIFRTKAKIEPDGTYASRLIMPAAARGWPSEWAKSLKSATNAGPTTYFVEKENSPLIEFSGPDSQIMNDSYGGDVYAVAKLGIKRLVAGTSNGCLWGRYEK